MLVEPCFPIPSKSRNHHNFLPIGLLKIAGLLRERGVNIKLERYDPQLAQQHLLDQPLPIGGGLNPNSSSSQASSPTGHGTYEKQYNTTNTDTLMQQSSSEVYTHHYYPVTALSTLDVTMSYGDLYHKRKSHPPHMTSSRWIIKYCTPVEDASETVTFVWCTR